MIRGGYIKIAREIIGSDVFHKPPLYLKVWLFLLCKAFYAPDGGARNGCLKTSVDEIRSACSYQKGYRNETPTKRQIYQILRYLRGVHEAPADGQTDGSATKPMISTTSVNGEIRIKILEFEKFQGLDGYTANEMFAESGVSNADGNSGGNCGAHTDGERAVNDVLTNAQLLLIKENKEKEIYRDQSLKPPKADLFAAYAGDDAELLDALRDFESMRRQQKKPMTERACKMLLGRLDELAGGDRRLKVKLLEQSILNCWLSVYPLKDEPGSSPKPKFLN